MATLLHRYGAFSDAGQPRKTLLNLNSQRNASQFCDVVLRVCGTQIFAHASVLAAASPYFSSFLGTGTDCPRAFSQKQPQVIEIHIDSMLIGDGDGGYGEAVGKVVEYMYTNEILITTNLFSQIIEIGRIMLLDQLLLYCEEFQKGIDGNMPKTVSTCTSTLKEVVDLLGTRVNSIKYIDAQTETEEILFEKVKILSPVLDEDHLPSSQSSGINKIFKPKGNIPSYSVDTDNSFVSESIKSVDKSDGDSLIFPTIHMERGFKNENVEVGETQTKDKFTTLNNCKIEVNPNVTNSEIKNSRTTQPSDSEPVEDFNAIKSFEDILEYDAVSAEQSLENTAATTSEGTGNEFTLGKPNDDQAVNESIHEGGMEGELQKFSDLVTFNTISSIQLPLKTKSRGVGRPRGRCRKRGRGRPKRRKETTREDVVDADSDYEFEQFIDKLEKGENVEIESQGIEDVTTQQIEEKKEDSLKLPTMLKKSDRVRSRPTQFKKDYILHSLSKKTGKKYGRALQEKRPIPSVQKVTNAQGNGLRFVCQECDFSTTVFKDYVDHLNDHPETDPKKCFVCQNCGFKTNKARQFKRHKEKHMTEELICIFCLFQASNLAEYKEHKLKHSGSLPYFCNECDSRFKKKCQLESHKPKHWLERPFLCPICGSGFKWKHALKNHMITHTAVKDHLCDICGYATAHKSMLTAHRLVHTGETLKCSVEGCHFEATKRQKLKTHMLTHTREKPHQCEVCGQRFSLAKNMRRHLLLHTNTRPFACKICSFTTTRYDKLKDHNHKLHNIGGPPVPKLPPPVETPLPSASDNTSTTATIMTAENVTLNPDGTISAESLQKIAEMAAGQQNISNGSGTTQFTSEEKIINITQPTFDSQGNDSPVVAHMVFIVQNQV